MVPGDDVFRPPYLNWVKPDKMISPFEIPVVDVEKHIEPEEGKANLSGEYNAYDVQTARYGFIGRYTAGLTVSAGDGLLSLNVESPDYATVKLRGGPGIRFRLREPDSKDSIVETEIHTLEPVVDSYGEKAILIHGTTTTISVPGLRGTTITYKEEYLFKQAPGQPVTTGEAVAAGLLVAPLTIEAMLILPEIFIPALAPQLERVIP